LGLFYDSIVFNWLIHYAIGTMINIFVLWNHY